MAGLFNNQNTMLAPDLAAQQNQLNRQQQLAQMLMQQGMQGNNQGTEVIGGWAIPKSGLGTLANAAMMGFGGYLQSQGDEKQAALANALKQQKMDAMANAWGMNQTDMSPTQANADAIQQNQTAPQAANYARALQLIGAGKEDLADKLLLNQFELTPEMKNLAFKGMNAKQVGQYELGKLRNDAMTVFDAGKSYLMPDTNEFVNTPNAQGMIYDPRTRSASAPEGFAEVNARLRGAEAEAIERAKAGNKLITVTPQGGAPMMMTERQVIEQATGNAPLPNGFTPFSGDLAKVRAEINKIPNPADRAAALAQLDAQIGKQKPAGVQLDTPEAAAGRLQRTKDMAAAAKEYEEVGAAGRSMLSDLKQLSAYLSDPNIYTGTGESVVNAGKKALSTIGIPVKGVASAEAAESIINKLTLASKSGMTGSMTDRDVQFLKQMVPQLNQTKEGQQQILGYLQKAAERQVQVADMARAYEQKFGAIDNGFRDQLKAFAEKNPLFPEKQAQKPAAPAKKEFNSLPNPADFNGKRMKAPDGSIIRSNGKQWVKE